MPVATFLISSNIIGIVNVQSMITELKGMKVTVFDKTDGGFMARYSDMYTEYILSFDK